MTKKSLKGYKPLLVFLIVLLSSVNSHAQAINQNSKQVLPSPVNTKIKITFKLIPSINNTWGYDILVDKKLTIHQPAIPAIPGNEGFKTKTAAKKTAEFVISKMKNGEMPPTITIAEMRILNVL